MEKITAIILGIIQGLTEFLPISSSGHVEIIRVLIDSNSIENNKLLFSTVIHGATALSTVIIFRNDIRKIITDVIYSKSQDSSLYIAYILVSMIPASIVGFFFKDDLSILFQGNLLLIGSMLFLTSALLFFTKKEKIKKKKLNFFNSFIIGLVQAFAILPGLSRSGSTIAFAIFLGVEKNTAARFSFLMVIPLILGGLIKNLTEIDFDRDLINMDYLIFGFISAFFSGLIACKLMLKLVKKSSLYYFSFYCFIVGLLSIIYAIK